MVKCDETVVHNDEFTGRLFEGKQVYLGEISLFCAVERMIFYSARRICLGYITQMIWQNDEFENIVKERFQKALDFARVFWYNVVT
jgi:hypothetical protein